MFYQTKFIENRVGTAFKEFMSNLIDYAGLFPPAQLSMDDAIRNYLKYKNDADEWMLSRFICPAKRLNELDKYRNEFRSLNKPLQVTFLGRGGESTEEFFVGLDEDLRMVNEFVTLCDGLTNVELYEVRLPENLIEEGNPVRISEFLNRIAEVIESKSPGEMASFYEGAFWGEWAKTIEALVEGISYHNIFVDSKRLVKYRPAGYKMRCGGAEPSGYPSPEQVAHVILTCKNHEIALKATAGLHHPVRHFNGTEQVKMHGFLNVFGGGIIAQYHDLKSDQIAAIIADENSEHFIFNNSKFEWKDYSITVDQIKGARGRRITSFGSCSFDEPREDLQELGFLRK